MVERAGGAAHGSWHQGPACQGRYVQDRIGRQVSLSAALATWVTFVQVWETNQPGKVVYHNSWVTEPEVEQGNVAVIVQIGRSKWKIENEQFKVHKNHGYQLEHNYGHGQQTLRMVFYLLTLVAFVAHAILEMGDRPYQQCRAQDSRRQLWNALRATMRLVLVESWPDPLLTYLADEGASRDADGPAPGASQRRPFLNHLSPTASHRRPSRRRYQADTPHNPTHR